MQLRDITTRAIVWAIAFVLGVAALSVMAFITIGRWTDDVIQANNALTQLVAEELADLSATVLDSLATDSYFATGDISHHALDSLNIRLREVTHDVLERVVGMEGGFYFPVYDGFYGYSFPTSPPPSPAYGPPPRSYEIIKAQALETIASGRTLIDVHRFDPAVFPLATVPIQVDGTTVGAIWTRVHIERKLPALRLRQVANISALVSLLSFFLVIFISAFQRAKIRHILSDLERIQHGEQSTVYVPRGPIGQISRSINTMLGNLAKAHANQVQLERELQQKRKMASLGTLVAGVAHEIRTPLAIIKTRVQMWQESIKSAPDCGRAGRPCGITEESIQLVVNETDRLARLIKRLLVFSKPVAEQFQPADINALIEHSISLVDSNQKRPDITIVRQLEAGLPRPLADGNSLIQVFTNVLNNAYEAMNEPGCITVESKLTERGASITIAIADSGPGIPEQILHRIFDPFFTTKNRGNGLGLSICYEIIAAHGGSIIYGPADGPGARCVITLPVRTGHQGVLK